MKVVDSAIPDVKIIEPRVFGDARGYFFESWNRAKYEEAGICREWVQDNESCSRYGVVRGLHYQLAPYVQAKLVRVIRGSVLDVAVDLRRDSPTFGKHVAVELTGKNKRQLFIPRGFAHGFAVLSEEAIFAYKCDNLYAPSHERGIAFNDPTINVDWRINRNDMVVSEKDENNPVWKHVEFFACMDLE